MLNIADKFWFYIRKIKKDMKELHDDDKLALDFLINNLTVAQRVLTTL